MHIGVMCEQRTAVFDLSDLMLLANKIPGLILSSWQAEVSMNQRHSTYVTRLCQRRRSFWRSTTQKGQNTGTNQIRRPLIRMVSGNPDRMKSEKRYLPGP